MAQFCTSFYGSAEWLAAILNGSQKQKNMDWVNWRNNELWWVGLGTEKEHGLGKLKKKMDCLGEEV